MSIYQCRVWSRDAPQQLHTHIGLRVLRAEDSGLLMYVTALGILGHRCLSFPYYYEHGCPARLPGCPL